MQTGIEELLKQTQTGSNPTSSAASQFLDNFKASKEYRHSFVEEKVRTQLAVQIKTIREQRILSRPAFAKLMRKAASWVFRLEDPNQTPPTISTLLQVAQALDIDLEIRFRPFSDLIRGIDRMTPQTLEVPSFDEELTDGSLDVSAQTLNKLGGRPGSGAVPPMPLKPADIRTGFRWAFGHRDEATKIPA
jgi:transcriptional regulator with XRE-family HTH domain